MKMSLQNSKASPAPNSGGRKEIFRDIYVKIYNIFHNSSVFKIHPMAV